MWLLADPSTKCYKDDTLLAAIALLRRMKLASSLRDQCRHFPPSVLPTLCHQCLIRGFAFRGSFALCGMMKAALSQGPLESNGGPVGEQVPPALSTGGGEIEVERNIYAK